jgi:2'-5' RNA ligase
MSTAFVAVVPPREVLDAVGKLSWRVVHRPGELALPRLVGPRYTTRDQWHITLQFLGNGVDLDAVGAALATVRARSAWARLSGIGGFPNPRRANVLWLGVKEGRSELSVIASAVAAVMAPLIDPSVADDHARREFVPHLTLARAARPADLRGAVTAAVRPVGPRWSADRLVLFESERGASGAHYRPHAEIVLDHP